MKLPNTFQHDGKTYECWGEAPIPKNSLYARKLETFAVNAERVWVWLLAPDRSFRLAIVSPDSPYVCYLHPERNPTLTQSRFT